LDVGIIISFCPPGAWLEAAEIDAALLSYHQVFSTDSSEYLCKEVFTIRD